MANTAGTLAALNLNKRDGRGNITRRIGSDTDIREQKEKGEELRRANDDLEQFAYSASQDLQGAHPQCRGVQRDRGLPL